MTEKNFNKRQLAQIHTADMVLEVCSKYKENLAKMPKFNENYLGLLDKRSEVGAQSVTKHQATAVKNSSVIDVVSEKQALAILVSDYQGPLSVYADEVNDSTLKSVLKNLGLSKLNTQKPMDMITTVNSFLVTAQKFDMKVVNAYGIEQEWLDEINAKVAVFSKLIPQKGVLNKNKPQATVDLSTVIKEMMGYKLTMDKLVVVFKKTLPSFFNEYSKVSVVSFKPTKTTTETPETAGSTPKKATEAKKTPKKKKKTEEETPSTIEKTPPTV